VRLPLLIIKGYLTWLDL